MHMTADRQAKGSRRTPRSWGSVRRLRSGRWQARTGPDPITGERTTISTYERKADADAALARAREERRVGGFVAPRAGKVLFAELAEQWLATRSTRPSTAARDVSYLRSKILPYLGHLEVARIDPGVLRRWVAELNQRGLSPATVVKAHQIVSKILAHAATDRLIPVNPSTLIDNLPRIPASKRRALSDEEVAALVVAMDARYRAMVLIGAFCGLRPGELIALRCDRLNLLRGTVDVTETATDVGGRVVLGPPKTAAGVRQVPMPRAVVTALAQHLTTLGAAGDDLLFPAPGGGYLRLNGWRQRFWYRAVAAAGIDPPISPHQLRHTAVTRWVREGVDLVTVARRAGHESVKTIADTYARGAEGLVPADDRVSTRADEVLAAVARARRGHDLAAVVPLDHSRPGRKPPLTRDKNEWALGDSNPRPQPCEGCALTN
jgi:integrase